MTASIPGNKQLMDLLFRDADEHGKEMLSKAQCQQLIREFGGQSSAYFNLQSDVQRFGVPDIGFIAYAPIKTLSGRVNIVFANPVCHSRMRFWLLKEFTSRVPGRFVFSGIDGDTARDLGSLGFSTTEMGSEFSVRIPGFSVAGRRKKQLRHAANLGKRHDIRVLEQTAEEVDLDQVREISEKWRHHKNVKHHELRLLTRPPVLEDEWGVRKFYAYQGGRLLGCVFFDPFFEQGRVIGYTANILRQDMDNSPSSLLDYIILTAMERFREEGIELLSLGIAPLYDVHARPGDNPMIRRTCQFLYEHANNFYAFKALSYHKTRYRGEETKWYLASRDAPALKVAWSMLRGTGILGKPSIEFPQYPVAAPVAG